MKGKRGLFGLLTAFISSLLTVTVFGIWNFSSSSTQAVSKTTVRTEMAVNQYSEDKGVCYLDNDTNTFYTSIEKALNVATSGRTVYVIPGMKDSSGNAYQVHVSHDCTIKDGVTLTLPYDGTTYFDADARGSSNIMADSSTANVKTYRQTQVVIDEGVTMTIASSGKLNIGGICGGPGQGLGGQTSGNYCEITMAKNSQIVSNGGGIDCYGFIKEYSALNNGSMVIMNSGKLITPFVIYDFKGGTGTLSICNLSSGSKFSPFAIFDFCNIQVKARIYANVTWEGRTMVYVSSSYYPSSDSDKRLSIIGPSSTNTAIVLTSGYIDVKYTPNTIGITESSYTKKTTTVIEVYGVVSLGGISLTVSTVTVDTTAMFFPVSFKLKFYIRSGSTMNFNKKAKFMGGSFLQVDEGAVTSITSPVVFYKGFSDSAQTLYPYPSMGDATFICNGTTNVTGSGALAGYLQTGSAKGVLNYTSTTLSVSSPECGGNYPSSSSAAFGSACSAITFTSSATGTMTNGSDTTFTGDMESINYTSAVNPTDSGSYAWYNASLVKPVNITSVSISQTSSTDGSLVLKAVPTPSDATGVTYKWSLSTTSVTLSSTSTQEVTISNSSTSNSVSVDVTVTATDYSGKSVTVTSNYTVTAAKSQSCITGDTLVMMADGTYKQAIDVRASDMLMSVNHETGELEAAPAVFNDDYGSPAREYDVVTLKFSNGKTVKVVSEHGFFDFNTMRYEYITEDNCGSFIGHRFSYIEYSEGTGVKGEAVLTDAYVSKEYTTVCSPVTFGNLNIITEGMLSMPGGISGMFNIFDYDADLSYNAEKKQQDIETYGLFDYSHFEGRLPYEFYLAFNGQYLKVAIGKGMLTEEMIDGYIARYIPIADEQNS